jgi:hypothetical protein
MGTRTNSTRISTIEIPKTPRAGDELLRSVKLKQRRVIEEYIRLCRKSARVSSSTSSTGGADGAGGAQSSALSKIFAELCAIRRDLEAVSVHKRSTVRIGANDIFETARDARAKLLGGADRLERKRIHARIVRLKLLAHKDPVVNPLCLNINEYVPRDTGEDETVQLYDETGKVPVHSDTQGQDAATTTAALYKSALGVVTSNRQTLGLGASKDYRAARAVPMLARLADLHNWVSDNASSITRTRWNAILESVPLR